jgi:hypothetical protein
VATSHLFVGRRVTELENVNAEKDRVLQEHSNQRNVSNFPKYTGHITPQT